MRLSIIILSLVSTIFATSCSAPKRAQWHYKKALKNGLKVVQDSDTIRITTIDSIPVIMNDTIVWQKYITTKDTIIKYNNIYMPRTRFQERILYKERIKTLRIKGDTQWKTAKAKQVVKYRWAWWPIVISFFIGILLRFLIQRGLLDRIALLFKL
jgi:hypothetical protein